MDKIDQIINPCIKHVNVAVTGEACVSCMVDRIAELEAQLAEFNEIVKAVAHIGIDWGYGKFELSQAHIDRARHLYETRGIHVEEQSRKSADADSNL